jgi:hypothetical protein
MLSQLRNPRLLSTIARATGVVASLSLAQGHHQRQTLIDGRRNSILSHSAYLGHRLALEKTPKHPNIFWLLLVAAPSPGEDMHMDYRVIRRSFISIPYSK